jgi:hypothetical protein
VRGQGAGGDDVRGVEVEEACAIGTAACASGAAANAAPSAARAAASCRARYASTHSAKASAAGVQPGRHRPRRGAMPSGDAGASRAAVGAAAKVGATASRGRQRWSAVASIGTPAARSR